MHVTTLAFVRLLLTHCRCLYFDTKLGETALLAAARSAKGDMIEVLLANGANSAVRDKVRRLYLLIGLC